MPVIVRLQFCIIRMYFKDHAPPHFHIDTPDDQAQMTIETLEILEGSVDRRALREAQDWAKANRDILRAAWKEYNP